MECSVFVARRPNKLPRQTVPQEEGDPGGGGGVAAGERLESEGSRNHGQ